MEFSGAFAATMKVEAHVATAFGAAGYGEILWQAAAAPALAAVPAGSPPTVDAVARDRVIVLALLVVAACMALRRRAR